MTTIPSLNYVDACLANLDYLAEFMEQRSGTEHLNPAVLSLDALGAKLLHQTLAVRGFRLMSDTWHQNPYNILFDAEDILRHAFILEYLGKAIFSPCIGDVQYSAGGDCIIALPKIDILWVDSSPSEYEIWRDWASAVNIRLRWHRQTDIKEAAHQIELWQAKKREADKAIAEWSARSARLQLEELESK